MIDDELRGVLARNLLALLNHAKDHEQTDDNGIPLSTALGLERSSGVGNSTISRWLKQEVAAKIDDVHRVALAYGLQGWQLLFPNLDPANPPVVPYTAAEMELYKVLKAGAEVIARQEGLPHHAAEGEVGEIRSSRPDSTVSSKIAAPAPKAAKRHKA
jgi:hypothetical protein